MCYTEQTWVPTLLIGLETFLGGMETWNRPQQLPENHQTLKPSLVEWKHRTKEEQERTAAALKPSLVEWKLFNSMFELD